MTVVPGSCGSSIVSAFLASPWYSPMLGFCSSPPATTSSEGRESCHGVATAR